MLARCGPQAKAALKLAEKHAAEAELRLGDVRHKHKEAERATRRSGGDASGAEVAALKGAVAKAEGEARTALRDLAQASTDWEKASADASHAAAMGAPRCGNTDPARLRSRTGFGWYCG